MVHRRHARKLSIARLNPYLSEIVRHVLVFLVGRRQIDASVDVNEALEVGVAISNHRLHPDHIHSDKKGAGDADLVEVGRPLAMRNIWVVVYCVDNFRRQLQDDCPSWPNAMLNVKIPTSSFFIPVQVSSGQSLFGWGFHSPLDFFFKLGRNSTEKLTSLPKNRRKRYNLSA